MMKKESEMKAVKKYDNHNGRATKTAKGINIGDFNKHYNSDDIEMTAAAIGRYCTITNIIWRSVRIFCARSYFIRVSRQYSGTCIDITYTYS